MSIIVQKYGGTSVGSVERMRHVADLVIAERKAGHHVVVVASAMAGATNHLVNLAQQFNNALGTAAYDFVVSTGENVSCGMLALALGEKGVNAIPMAGWQVPIKTNELHSKARIVDIETAYLTHLLHSGVVPVITGFQGIGADQRLTTLGRGGSDTSAVAIAAALKAKRCDIYTDIDGIYTADPRIVADAKFIAEIPYSAAFQMASLGTKIIHPRAVECGMQSNMPLRILSSFGSDKFTLLLDNVDVPEIVGISHIQNYSKYTLSTQDPEVALDILAKLKDVEVSLSSLMVSPHSLEFCAEYSDSGLVKAILDTFKVTEFKTQCSKISVVGKAAPKYLEETLEILKAQAIKVFFSSTHEMQFSVLVPQEQMELVVNTLHAFFFNLSTKKVDF